MKAVVVKEPGGAEQLLLKDFSKPVPGKGEILIKVKASAINRTDIVSREGKSGYMANPILGIEVSGEVVETGEGANIQTGTRVMGLVNGGGYAQYALMPADRAMKIPDNL